MNLLSAFCRKQMIWNLRRRSGSGLPPGIRRFSGGAKTDKVGQALCLPSRKGGIRVPGLGRMSFHNSIGRDDGDGVFGSGIIDTIGPFQADEPLPVALSEGHHDAAPP